MGRQITVEFPALEAAGCQFTLWSKKDAVSFIHQAEAEQPATRDFNWVEVHIDEDRSLNSDFDDCLVFDCRNEDSPNYWMERWLIDKGVPYVWG